MTLLLIALLAIVVGPFVMSTGEWTLHKHVMHTRWWFLWYPYEAHHVTHHGLFSGEKYLLENRSQKDITADKEKITMAWWSFIVVIPLGSLPYLLAAAPFALFGWWSAAYILVGIGAFFASANYAIYETIHYCMHVPNGALARLLQKWEGLWRIVLWLDRHHSGHHKDPRTNLNVVFPFADWLFGTLRTGNPGLVESSA